MNVTFETTHKNKAGTTEWLTPPSLLENLGTFDLDPCSPINRPWDTALNHFTINDDGLKQPWYGRVWCNPPYGDEAEAWLKKCAEYRNCTALIFARTETKAFTSQVWGKAAALLFLKGRLRFYHVTGQKGGTAGAPSVLVAYDMNNARFLAKSGIEGSFNVNVGKLTSPEIQELLDLRQSHIF